MDLVVSRDRLVMDTKQRGSVCPSRASRTSRLKWSRAARSSFEQKSSIVGESSSFVRETSDGLRYLLGINRIRYPPGLLTDGRWFQTDVDGRVERVVSSGATVRTMGEENIDVCLVGEKAVQRSREDEEVGGSEWMEERVLPITEVYE